MGHLLDEREGRGLKDLVEDFRVMMSLLLKTLNERKMIVQDVYKLCHNTSAVPKSFLVAFCVHFVDIAAALRYTFHLRHQSNAELHI